MPNIPRATRELNQVLIELDNVITEFNEISEVDYFPYEYLIEDMRDVRADLHGAMSWLL